MGAPLIINSFLLMPLNINHNFGKNYLPKWVGMKLGAKGGQ